MNKLIDFIIAFSLKRKYLIICLTLAAVVIGVLCFKDTPVDAFPDVTNTKVICRGDREVRDDTH